MPGDAEEETNDTLKPVVVFLHIPKTAGTSLSHVLKRKFKPNSILQIYSPSECVKPLVDHAAKVNDSIDCVSGHITFGIHRHLSRPCDYFTMLRDPVERVLSHYRYTQSKDANTHSLSEAIEFAQQNTIVDYLQRFPAIAFEQIRIVSGVTSFDRSALQVAKDNISSDRIRVSLTEDFFQSTELIFHDMELGYPRFPLKRKNTGTQQTNYQSQKSPDTTTMEAIKEICQLDIEFYEHARKHYEAKKEQYQARQLTPDKNVQRRIFQAYRQFLER